MRSIWTGGRSRRRSRPSAETLLHCQIYRLFPEARRGAARPFGAGTVLSMASLADDIALRGLRAVQKAFAGQTTHEASLDLPVVRQRPGYRAAGGRLEPVLRARAPLGYLIRGHGVYVWGAGHAHRAGPAGGARVPARLRAREEEIAAMSRLTIYLDDARPAQPELAHRGPGRDRRRAGADRRAVRALGQPGRAEPADAPPRRSSPRTGRISTR